MTTARRSSQRVGDCAIVVGLAVLSIVPRLGAVPKSGFFHDDAWTAAGAMHGQPLKLFEYGVNHPGFSGLLLSLRPLSNWDPVVLIGPSLLAGIVGPAAIYVLLRHAGFASLVSLAPAVLVVVAPIHVLMSPRVKPFTIDMLVVVVAALVVVRLTSVCWSLPVAAGWVVGSVAVSVFSPFSLLAAAVAGLMLVLHPSGDLWLRVVAVATQAVASLVHLLTVQRSYDAAGLEQFWGRRHDPYVGFDSNPLTTLGDVLANTGEVVAGFTAVSPGIGSVLGLVACAGLLHAAVLERSILGRYLGLLLGGAIVLSIVGKVPFGSQTFPGLRLSLWAIPAFGFGAAQVVTLLARSTGRQPVRRWVELAAVVGALAVFAVGVQRDMKYPWNGTEPAVEFTEAAIEPGDRVLLLFSARFAFAVYGETGVEVVGEPSRINGMSLRFDDARILGVGLPSNPASATEEIAAVLAGAERVLVVSGIQVPGGDPVGRAVPALETAGFERSEDHSFGTSIVSVWVPTVR